MVHLQKKILVPGYDIRIKAHKKLYISFDLNYFKVKVLKKCYYY